MDVKGGTNIQVAIRMRPLITTEHANQLRAQWSSQSNVIYPIDDSGHRHQFGDIYTFDHIFGTDKTNLDIYNDIVKDFVESSLSGLNSTIFAYGQTSSGKTYTMLGDKTDMGIMPLAIENIFEIVKNNKHRKYLLRVSYMEIYNEKINDLLEPSNKEVKIRELFPSTIAVQNIKEELVTSKEQMYECLKTGNLNRHIGTTKANERSSRSHTIFKIVIESAETGDPGGNGCIQISNLNLVDLAGSERVAQTKATGMRLKEGGHINKSLSALSLVIKQLSDGQEFVNFRDSKLTRLLQDSLGGNSKTLIIATITLASVEDTASTLAFAQRAKTVKNKPRVNEILTEADVNKRNVALNAELQKKLQEQMMINQNFQKTEEEYFRRITNLQQQVKMLEDFQGKHSPVKPIPKRRHTIGFSSKKQRFPRLPPCDFEHCLEDNNADITLFEDLIKRDPPSTVCKLNTIEEEEDPVSLDKFSTPENYLRLRLSSLQEEYDELASFTRNENNIFNETAVKADELEKQLDETKEKILNLEIQLQQKESDFESTKLELQRKIEYLEDELKWRPENADIISDKTEIVNELIRLQEILKTPGIFDVPECTPPEEDSVLQIIKKFNVKAKTSKHIIETEILKQINNFDCSQDQIDFPNELESFNDLLKQLSLFESDIPVDVIDNMKKETVEDFKVLIKIYEAFLRKNEIIRNYRDKIEYLEGNTTVQREEINNSMNNTSEHKHLTETIHSPETHRNNILLREENLLQEINELKVRMKKMADDADVLNAMLNEKNNNLFEVEKNYTLMIQENEDLKQKFFNSSSENTGLKNELIKLKNDLLDRQGCIDKTVKKCATQCETMKLQEQIAECLAEELSVIKRASAAQKDELHNLNLSLMEKDKVITEMKNTCTKLKEDREKVAEIQNKQSLLSNLEQDCTLLKLDVEKLSRTNDEKDKIICEIHNTNRKLTSEIQNLREKFKNLEKQNQELKAEIGNMKKKSDAISLEAVEKCRQLELEAEFANQNVNEMLSVKQQLTNEIKDLKKVIQDRQHAINSSEQKLNQSERRIQTYKQLLEKAHTEINSLKDALADREKLNCEISDYRCQLNVSSSKLQKCMKINEDLTLKIKELEMKANVCDKNCSKDGANPDLDRVILNLGCAKKKLEDVLGSVIEQVLGEQKTLLLNRQSQDRRDGFKSIIRNLKSSNIVLKSQHLLLQKQDEYDVDEIKDNLLKSKHGFHEYLSLEKSFLQKQIEELNSTNEQYLQEIMTLKNSQICVNMNDCPQCKLLKAEITKLQELPATQEKMLSSLKDKNKMLAKENIERVKQVVDLQTKFFKEQDRKAEVEYTELLKFYRDNGIMQQKLIESLKQEIKQYQKTCERNKQSTEVQCNIIQQEEVNCLRLELAQNRKTENLITRETTSVAVQCDETYKLMKKLLHMRNLEIQTLKAKIVTMEAQKSSN